MKKLIVIGAGILGASTAFHLAKAGADVTVIDRGEPGQATDAAAGIICPWVSQRRNKAWYALAKGGAAYYETLIRELESDGEKETGYVQAGAISLHSDEEKLEKLEDRAVKRREDAPQIGDIRRLSAEETNRLFPPLSGEYPSVLIGGAARVNGRALRKALLSAAIKHGAHYVEGSAVLEHNGNTITGVMAGEKKYEGDAVLVTAGAWAGELFAPLGVDLLVSGQKAQILHLQLKDRNTADWPVVMPPNDQYLLSFDDGRVVIGATHEDHTGFDLRVTAGGMQEVLSKALGVAPGLGDAEFVEARVGFRPFTPNFLPVIGEVPGWEGLFLANGLGASGLTVGPYLGAQLAKLTLGESTDIDLELYSVAGAIKGAD